MVRHPRVSQCSGTKLLTIWIIKLPWPVFSIIHNLGSITPQFSIGQGNMSPHQRVAEGVGLWSKEEREEKANLTQLAWLAIIAPSLSVLERPSCRTIWTQLPAVYQWPLCPSPTPLPPNTLPVLPFGRWLGRAMPHQTRMRPINEHC